MLAVCLTDLFNTVVFFEHMNLSGGKPFVIYLDLMHCTENAFVSLRRDWCVVEFVFCLYIKDCNQMVPEATGLDAYLGFS